MTWHAVTDRAGLLSIALDWQLADLATLDRVGVIPLLGEVVDVLSAAAESDDSSRNAQLIRQRCESSRALAEELFRFLLARCVSLEVRSRTHAVAA